MRILARQNHHVAKGVLARRALTKVHLRTFEFYAATLPACPGCLRAAIYNTSVDHHTLAAISISGTCLDVLGSLYLAYDLLGGQHSPLRLLTRIVTYSIVFGAG